LAKFSCRSDRINGSRSSVDLGAKSIRASFGMLQVED
jgi:hypothetical protein